MFFFKDPATTGTYTYGQPLSLHDARPISAQACNASGAIQIALLAAAPAVYKQYPGYFRLRRQEGAGDALIVDDDFYRCAASSHKAQPLCIRSEEHTSELHSLMRTSYAVFCLKKKTQQHTRLQSPIH